MESDEPFFFLEIKTYNLILLFLKKKEKSFVSNSLSIQLSHCFESNECKHVSVVSIKNILSVSIILVFN